jgi:thiol-disulfide isomerase/thioredoxin
MKKAILIIVGIITVVIVGVLVFSGGGELQEADDTQVDKTAKLAQAPSFSLKNYSGNTVNLSDFSGKLLVLNSWAAWCPFCRQELLDFAEVQKEFGEQIVIIAIDRAEALETAKRYSDDLGVTDDLIFLLDRRDSFYQSIGGFSMPETVFVDGNGFIRDHKRGFMNIDEMRQRIKQAFNL